MHAREGALSMLMSTADPAWTRERVIAEFLESEFDGAELAKLATYYEIAGRSRFDKRERAEAVAKEVASTDDAFDHMQWEWLSSPKRWLALRVTDEPVVFGAFPKLLGDRTFLDSQNQPGWYGPFRFREDTDFFYYIGVIVRRWGTEQGDDGWIGRWNVLAAFRGKSVSFHWKNLSTPKGRDAPPYWDDVEGAIEKLLRKIPGEWVKPDLKELMLETLWAKYRTPADPAGATETFSFQDTFVFARELGISLTAAITKQNAKAAADDDGDSDSKMKFIDLARIENLTNKLTELALQNAGVFRGLPQAQLTRAQDAVKHAFIKGWNTRRYECMIIRQKPSRKNVFMAKAFFGNDEREGSFQHLKCDPDFGLSWGAAEFLLRELNVW